VSKRRVGYVGKDNVSVGAAWEGVVHWEASPGSHQALCNGRNFTMAGDPELLVKDRGILTDKLNICKRCLAKS